MRLPNQCETITCPDIHLIVHAWSRVRGLISNLSQVVKIMKGSERLCQLQQPTVWLQQQVKCFAVGMHLNNHAHHKNIDAS